MFFKNRQQIFYIFIILLKIDFSFAQPLSLSYFDHELQKIAYDAGFEWNELSSIISDRDDGSSYINNYLGLYFYNAKTYLLGYGKGVYKNNFFAFFDSKITYLQDVFRGSETSGFGFKNNWVLLQISNGKEDWGSGEDISLALSEDSDAYDYILVSSDYGNFRVSYIHGFLETLDNDFNRYINGRGFEWSNKKSFILSFTETIIYSGYKRSLDFGYLNPMSSHLEVELNDRLNINGVGSANAVWQVHFDCLINNRSRFSANYLFDEFVFDPDIEIGKEHGKAYSLRYAFSIISDKNKLINIYLNKIYVGTPTLRHGDGLNNFVNNNKPLGWKYGSDSDKISIGSRFSNNKNIIFNLNYGFLRSGEETILSRFYDPYADYKKGLFPSGNIIKSHIIDFAFQYLSSKNISVLFKGELVVKNYSKLSVSLIKFNLF